MEAQRAIARRFVVGLPVGVDPAWERDFASHPPAGVILFRRDFGDLESLRALTRRLRALAGPHRIFVAMDEEGGFVSQLAGPLIVPPGAHLLGRGASPGDLEWVARVTGERLRALGVDWVFAPVADVHSRPENPVIGPRSFGTEPKSVSAAVGAVLGGFRAAGIGSCLKHFPGHGDTTTDSHATLPRSEAAPETLERRELVPFRDHSDADSIMTAHVLYQALDAERPATFSPTVLGDLLRERLGFRNVAITDALEMRGALDGRPLGEAARLALEAGADLLLFAFHDESLPRIRLEIARRLASGTLDRAAFAAARSRLAAFDARIAVPREEELARPLEALTPPDWVARLEGIVDRGLIVEGALPAGTAAGTWFVTEPPFEDGLSLAEELGRAGVAVGTADTAAMEVHAVRERAALPESEIERLRARCRLRPVVLVGLQNDSFLDRIPEAALHLSAADATPLTRRVVARRIARATRAGAQARA